MHRPRFPQRGVIRMIAVFQRVDCLVTDRLGGHEPQDHAVLRLEQGVVY